jgi:hypothetical protein
VPLSIYQELTIAYQNQNRLNAQHVVEEAMTAALLRTCNNCYRSFAKDGGCNHITCSCGNHQCFVCSINIDGHDHFDQAEGNCPLFDNTDARLRREVARAQEDAVQERLQLDGALSEEDVLVDPNLRNVEEEEAIAPIVDNERDGIGPWLWFEDIFPPRPMAVLLFQNIREEEEREREEQEREAREREAHEREAREREQLVAEERARLERQRMERVQRVEQQKERRRINRAMNARDRGQQNKMGWNRGQNKGNRALRR